MAGMVTALSAGAQAPDWGKGDTIEYYSIGPGAMYARIEFTKKPLHVFQTTIDLNNPYNNVELYPSNLKTPDPQRETTSSQCKIIHMQVTGHFAGLIMICSITVIRLRRQVLMPVTERS